MRRTLVLLATLLAASLFGAEPSRAQLPECPDSYVAGFDVPATREYPAWSAGDIDCREHFIVAVDTPTGAISVRGIGDVNVAATLPPGGLDAIRRGVALAGERMQRMGDDLRLWNTTILISRPRSSVSEPQQRFGYSAAWTLPGSSGRGSAECHVTLFIQTDFTAEEIHYAVAHELFHCIQQATLSRLLTATMTGAGAWWAEGSAEWFAAFVAGPQSRWPRARQFDEAVAENAPLHGMSYKMAIFFYWYSEHHGGPPAILPFLTRMSPGNDAASQESAMRYALPAEQWLAFAEAYDDRRIRYPSGSGVLFGQRVEGETWSFEGNSAHARLLKSFVIGVGWSDYACGRWDNSVTDANVGVRPDHQTTWSRWPEEIDTRETARSGRRFRMVGLVVESATELDFQVETERRESCVECLTSTVVDACVVGRWRQTDGGPLEYLRRNGVPITYANQTELVITMSDDGTFSTNAIATDVGMEAPLPHGRVMHGVGVGETSAVRGRWSAEDGELLGCIDSGGVADGVTVVSVGDVAHAAPWSGAGMGGTGGATTYTCSDTTFTTSAPTRHGPMNYIFTRETPPPRRR